VLNVAVPGPGGELSRLSLARREGFHSDVSLSLEGCPGARLERSIGVLDTDSGGFQVALDERWSGLSTCPNAARVMPTAPAADCRASLVLDYGLVDGCETPCELRVTGASATCSCNAR
jgi:hypothetical protein